jgi:hypothetical protein
MMDLIILFKLLKIICGIIQDDEYKLNLLRNLFIKNEMIFISEDMKFYFKRKSIKNLLNKKYIIIVKDNNIFNINFNCHFHIITNKNKYNYPNKNIITIGDKYFNKETYYDICLPISKILNHNKIKLSNIYFPWVLKNNKNIYKNLLIDPFLFLLNHNYINNININKYKNKIIDNEFNTNISLKNFLNNNIIKNDNLYKLFNFYLINYIKTINSSNVLQKIFIKICYYNNENFSYNNFKLSYDFSYIIKNIDKYILNNKLIVIDLILNYNNNLNKNKLIKCFYDKFINKNGFKKIQLLKRFFKNKDFILYKPKINNYINTYKSIILVENDNIYDIYNLINNKIYIHIITNNKKYNYPEFKNIFNINYNEFLIKNRYYINNYHFIIKKKQEFKNIILNFLNCSCFNINNINNINYKFLYIKKNKTFDINYIKLNKKSNIIVISYYTKKTIYAKEILNLKYSIDKLNLNYHISAIDDMKDWNLNTYYKATFIKEMLLKYPNNKLLYVDADAVLHKLPNIIYDLDYKCDLGISYFNNTLRSGTLYIKNTKNTKNIVDEWININNKILKENINKKNYNCKIKIQFEQRNLDLVLKKLNYKYIYYFDISYCMIDNDKYNNILIYPIIEHFQASRIYVYKNKYKKDVNRHLVKNNDTIYIISSNYNYDNNNKKLNDFFSDNIVISNNKNVNTNLHIFYLNTIKNNKINNNKINILIIKKNKDNIYINNNNLLLNNKNYSLKNIDEFYFSNYKSNNFFSENANSFFCYNDINIAAIQYCIIKKINNINLIGFDYILNTDFFNNLLQFTQKKYKDININIIDENKLFINKEIKSESESNSNIIINIKKNIVKKQIIVI